MINSNSYFFISIKPKVALLGIHPGQIQLKLFRRKYMLILLVMPTSQV